MILVSICMTTYNHKKFIRHALESVLMQKCNFDYEILIGDDCSQDSTVVILKEYEKAYPDKIRLIIREKNIGMVANSFDIRSRAKGKYIAMLEGDDYWIDSYKLQKQVEFLESHLECSAVASRVGLVNEREHPLGKLNPAIDRFNDYFGKEDAIKYNTLLFDNASLMYRNFFRNSKGRYSWMVHGKKYVGGHMLMVFLLASMGKIYISSEIMACYRVVSRHMAFNASSLFIEKDEGKWRIERVEFFQYLKQHLGDEYDFTKPICNEFALLAEYLYLNNIAERNKILKNLFLSLTAKERLRVPLCLIKKIYF